MQQPYTIRAAAPEDLPRVSEIRLAVTENVLSDPSKIPAEEVEWYRSKAIFLVAEVEGRVVGFACANHLTGLVWALFMDAAYEGRGIGRALMDAALAGLERAGHRQAHLNTGAGTRAERFYRAHGWRDMGLELGGQIVFTRAIGN
jgi:GNAT superfamily N-acetyltransferase